MIDTAELLPKTKRCYVCGPENPSGLHVRFSPEGDNGSRATYTARPEHAGWPGMLHGALTFTLMDEALGWALYFHGLTGVTARVETRFRQPIPIGSKLVVRAWMIEKRRRTITARAEVRGDTEESPLLAEAGATMYLVDIVEEWKG